MICTWSLQIWWPSPAGAAVDHDADLAFGQPERLRRRRVEHLLHRLHFQEVVSRPLAADLVQPAANRAAAHLSQVGAVGDAAVLPPVQVPLAAVPACHRIAGPVGQQLFELRPAAQLPQAAAPGAARDHGGEPVHHPAQHRDQLASAEVGGEQPDPAGDVEPDPARGDHAAPGDIGGGDPADREPVSPVHVGHRIRRLDDAGSSATLTTCSSARSPSRIRDQRARGEHHAGHPHPAVPRDDEPVRRFRDDLHRGITSSREGLRVPGPAYGVRDRARAGREICSAMVPLVG
jgi:hypothetical protein